MGDPQPAPLSTLLKPSTVAAYTAAGFWGDQTIYHLAVRQARATPRAFAVRDRDRRLSYPELVNAADRLAAHLDRVAVWLPSRVETAIALLACSRNGYMCCSSLHRNHRVREVVALAERMRCSALIAQPAYGADADRCGVFSELASRDFVRCAWRIGSADAVPFGELPGPALEAERSGDANQVMYLPFTSGTTGEPKGVMHSDNTLLATARAMARDWRLERAVLYTLSPLSHNLGLGALITALAGGGELVLHDLPRGANLLDRLEETGAEFAVADGALGFWKALGEGMADNPASNAAGCKKPPTNHPEPPLSSCRGSLHTKAKAKAKGALQEIWMAETKKGPPSWPWKPLSLPGKKYRRAADCLTQRPRCCWRCSPTLASVGWQHINLTAIICGMPMSASLKDGSERFERQQQAFARLLPPDRVPDPALSDR